MYHLKSSKADYSLDIPTSPSEITPEILYLSKMCEDSNAIEKDLYFKHNVKRGLRDVDGRGVIAGLTNIPSELMEAGQIDGANAWQVIRHIKIPLVTNSITICTFLGCNLHPIGALLSELSLSFPGFGFSFRYRFPPCVYLRLCP